MRAFIKRALPYLALVAIDFDDQDHTSPAVLYRCSE